VTTEAQADAIRRLVLEQAIAAGACHIGSALSIVDVLAVLYGRVLRDGDRFLLSKGHAAAALYATLQTEGVLDDVVREYCSDGGSLPGHPERGIPGIEMTGGSLGHGPAIALGLALADPSRRVYCVVGDGELQEGSVWEALGLAGHLRPRNLVLVVDANGLQGLGRTDEIVGLALGPRLAAFGWRVAEADGHDHAELLRALAGGAGPLAVVARTVKGYGVPFMEGELMWHYRTLKPEQRETTLASLRRAA
jgi:transketolase